MSGQTDWIARMLGYLNAGEPWIVSVRDCAEYHNAVMALIKQRDEARREACLWALAKGVVWNEAMLARAKAIAAERGWDCFAQEGGGA